MEQSFSGYGADTPWGYHALVCASQQLFQTVACGCYFNFESTEVNLVHITGTGYYCYSYCDEYDRLLDSGSVNTT